MKKSNLLDKVVNLVAYNKITNPFGAIYKRLDRKYRTVGKEVYDGLIKGNKLPQDSIVEAKLHWEDTNLARSYSLALQEFKQVDPKGHERFMEIKKKHTKSRRNYVIFGTPGKKELSEDIYLKIIEDVGLDTHEASKVYEFLNSFDKRLNKENKENLEKLLIKL